MEKIKAELERLCASLKEAATVLAVASAEDKNRALLAVADGIEKNSERLLRANKLDTDAYAAAGGSASMLDRLTLTEKRVSEIAEGVRSVAALPDPVGEVTESFVGADGLRIERVRVPLGIVGIIYEARPNVTADCAALCLKTGNAVLLRGSASAINSNREMVAVIREALLSTAVPDTAVMLMEDTSREASNVLMSSRGLIDVLIPRGGGALIRAVADNARVPVLETGVGNCHVYVHPTADPLMAKRITVNAKTDRPSVCNAAETLLIDKSYPHAKELLTALTEAGVTLHGDEETLRYIPDAVAATFPEDYEAEHLSLDMAVRFVDGLDGAVAHIARFGSGHTEAIIAEDVSAAEEFLSRVDAAVVNHNASTRYTDGGMFGFGAEIGISTQKLHARGPMGLRELTSYKYKVRGEGQIRNGDNHPTTVAVIGSGFMASAFVAGLVDTGTLSGENITVINPAEPESRDRLCGLYGCVAGDAADVAGKSAVLFAVKPQTFGEAAQMYGDYIGDALVLSIMAGIRTDTLTDALGGRRVVRFMPNLALSRKKSATAYCLGRNAVEADAETAERLFSPLGVTVRVEEEQMDGVTALSGSGPAYICRLLEGMIGAAVADGFDEDSARSLAVQTLVGTAALLEDGSVGPAALRGRITSKGGTTAAALGAMDETGFDGAVFAAYLAAKRRAEELSKI